MNIYTKVKLVSEFNRMGTFFLFLLTGVVTVLPVIYMLAGAWMGVPVVATEYSSIVGSCLLISSAFMSLFSKKHASQFAIAGTLGIASFWITEPIKALKSGGAPVALLVGLGVIWLMLAATLAVAVRGVRAAPHMQTKSRGRKAILSVFMVLFLLLIVAIEWQQKASERIPSRYQIPDGYVGWVVIQYDIAGTPAVPVSNKQLVFVIPQSGLLKTSSSQQFGEAHDQYLYCGSSGCRELADTGWGKGGMVWDESSGTSQETGKQEIRSEQFFVGTEAQYKKMQDLPNTWTGVVPGDIKAKLQ